MVGVTVAQDQEQEEVYGRGSSCCYSFLYFALRSAAAGDATRRVVYVRRASQIQRRETQSFFTVEYLVSASTIGFITCVHTARAVIEPWYCYATHYYNKLKSSPPSPLLTLSSFSSFTLNSFSSPPIGFTTHPTLHWPLQGSAAMVKRSKV